VKFSRLLKVVQVHVCTKFHQAKCSGTGIIMLTEHAGTVIASRYCGQ